MGFGFGWRFGGWCGFVICCNTDLSGVGSNACWWGGLCDVFVSLSFWW